MDLTAELIGIEEAGWQALVDGVGPAHFRAVADEQVVVLGPGYGVARGPAALDRLSGETWSWFRVRNPQLVEITESVASLTYRLVARHDFDTEHQAVVASTYRRSDDGSWRLVLRQQTPM